MNSNLKKRIKDKFRTYLATALLRLAALFPLPVAHALGTGLGWVLASTPNELRRITRINIELCLPELSAAARTRLVRRSLIESGRGLMEVAAAWLWPADRVLDKIREVDGEGHLREAMAQGKGVILAMPHLGAWEVMVLYLGAHYPLTTMARPLRIRGMDGLVRRARSRSGGHLVPTDKTGVRAVYDALGKGEMSCILMDQEPSMGSGVFAPFFGVDAKTAVLLPRLALRTGAPVIFACAERLPRGKGYRLRFKPEPSLVVSNDLAATTRNLNRSAEALVREKASQYLWSYKRFRSRPPEKSKIY